MQVSHQTTWTSAFVLMVITIIAISNFTKSRHGRACIAIREDEIAADSMGINTTYYKVVAFALGSFFAGVAGALYAHNFYIIQPVAFLVIFTGGRVNERFNDNLFCERCVLYRCYYGGNLF